MKAAALIWGALALAACGSESSGPGPVTSVTLSPAEDTLTALGATLQLSAVARDAGGDSIPQFFLWRSSAPNVVSVDDTGLATARGTGPATITAMVATGQVDTAHLIVVQTLATIVVSPRSLRGIGATSAPFEAVGRDSNDSTIAGVTFTWSSSDTSVAVISTEGVATARALGTTAISAAAASVTGQADLTVDAHYYVDAGTGDDAGSGTTAAAPFRTITRALTVAATGNTIKVLPGNYITRGVGGVERFPFVGPAGVILLGDEANKGGGATPTIVGRRNGSTNGTSLFEPPANAVVAGFTIVDSGGPGLPSVFIRGEGFVFRNNRILRAVGGGLYVGVSSGSITDNLIASNGRGFGMRICGGGPAFRFEGNTFTGNGWGIFAECAGAAVNGGSTGSRANIITCNVDADIVVASGVAFSALNNLWDHVPPTSADTAGGGVDVVFLSASARAVTTGAGVAPSPCP